MEPTEDNWKEAKAEVSKEFSGRCDPIGAYIAIRHRCRRTALRLVVSSVEGDSI
jgi:hypothetical protein